jgi:hypothetical protein
VQTPSKPGAQAAVPYRAYRALVPSAGLLRIVRLVRTFFQTAGPETERKDGQITTRKFDHPDKTKDLAGIGKSRRVFSTGAGVAAAGVVSWIGTKPACPILNLGCEETQSNGAYFKLHRPRGRTITLVGNRKVPSSGHPDRPHFSAWRGDGAPSLLSRWVGRPARRTEALAGTPAFLARGNRVTLRQRCISKSSLMTLRSECTNLNPLQKGAGIIEI